MRAKLIGPRAHLIGQDEKDPPFSKKEVEQIRWLGESYKEESSRVVNNTPGGVTHENTRATDVTWIQRDKESEGLYRKIIFMLQPWHVVRLEVLQYSVYRVGGFFDWHNDNSLDANPGDFVSSGIRARVVTCVVHLSDPSEYTGGGLELSTPDGVIKAPMQQGRVSAFTSSIYHRVLPVITGTRRTLVCWGLA